VPSDWDLVLRVALAFPLTFAIGFEREIRGGPAGDRTYSLVGMAAAAISAIAVAKGGPNAIAGVVTGVGFIGAALVFRGEGGVLRGITSASAVFGTAAVGVVAGAGYPILALAVTGGVLLSLEVRYLPILRYLDARRYVGSVRSDTDPPGPVRGRRSQGDPST
jgi:putative Mg2+ transporter-C (MgtC) family protein